MTLSVSSTAQLLDDRYLRVVVAHQTFGDMLRWNPHFHAIVLEGGFDEEGTFFYIPFSGLQSMVEIFHRRVIKLLVECELLNENFGRNLLSWKHSGFSIDNSVCILDDSSQESLAEYNACKSAWARLLAKVYEIDPLMCSKCGSEMKVIVVIKEPEEIKRIFRHLIKIGRPPPGFDAVRLN